MEDNRELLEDLRALADDLRSLAMDGPRQAPDRVELQLRAEFRRRVSRRRAKVWASFGGVAALAAGIALFAGVREAPAPAAAAPVIAAVPAVAEDEAADASFYPLPEAEALPAVENAMVVRVQLPVSSLRLMGFPMDEDGSDGAVQAELLLGQDGLARGVRLVE